MTKRFDVVGIGNAIVDVLAHVEDSFVNHYNMPKGGMRLIDQKEAETLYQAFPPAHEVSGGSAANTIAGLASLGGKGAFIGKVRHDQLGAIFRHDLTTLGVHFTTPPAKEGPATATCLIAVTPDAQRTMNTFLGIAPFLHESDMEESVLAATKITYVEGYLWDQPMTKDAIRHAIRLTKKHGGRIAFTLSDSFCVNRHRAEFLELLKQKSIDILFANEAEVKALFNLESFEAAAAKFIDLCPLAVLTRSEHGCVIVTPGRDYKIPAERVANVVDTTGAGDLFASGFLYGLTHERPLEICGKLGNLAASETIQHLGARPEAPLSEVVKRV